MTMTFAGVAGQVSGKRRPSKVLLISSSWRGWLSNVLGMLVNAIFSPTPAGSVGGRMVTAAGLPSCVGWPYRVVHDHGEARKVGLAGRGDEVERALAGGADGQ